MLACIACDGRSKLCINHIQIKKRSTSITLLGKIRYTSFLKQNTEFEKQTVICASAIHIEVRTYKQESLSLATTIAPI